MVPLPWPECSRLRIASQPSLAGCEKCCRHRIPAGLIHSRQVTSQLGLLKEKTPPDPNSVSREDSPTHTPRGPKPRTNSSPRPGCAHKALSLQRTRTEAGLAPRRPGPARPTSGGGPLPGKAGGEAGLRGPGGPARRDTESSPRRRGRRMRVGAGRALSPTALSPPAPAVPVPAESVGQAPQESGQPGAARQEAQQPPPEHQPRRRSRRRHGDSPLPLPARENFIDNRAREHGRRAGASRGGGPTPQPPFPARGAQVCCAQGPGRGGAGRGHQHPLTRSRYRMGVESERHHLSDPTTKFRLDLTGRAPAPRC